MHHANQNPSAEVTSQGWLVCFMGEPVLKHLPKAIATVRRGMLLSEALLSKNFSNKRRVDGRVAAQCPPQHDSVIFMSKRRVSRVLGSVKLTNVNVILSQNGDAN